MVGRLRHGRLQQRRRVLDAGAGLESCKATSTNFAGTDSGRTDFMVTGCSSPGVTGTGVMGTGFSGTRLLKFSPAPSLICLARDAGGAIGSSDCAGICL